MKINTLIILAAILISSCTTKPEVTTNTKQLRHIVLFKFKEASSHVDVKKVEAAFVNLPTKIKEIKGFEWGLNNSTEDLNKDFTHCFMVTFKSEEDRNTYLPHPDHLAFVEVLKPHLEDVLVLDYWAK
ncbi:hypothetical protein BTO04_04365 [Polaribacter sp. SA4-10]|uniref:Dabb family protein n=1 Tax=Polaribacter sp. SA4-10 TaxID=754397 RepID=UPI000B3D4621|nr:Dabb family protein [Polaribacter sp. SA4-10]ARV05980.1 hypothetical protein BTO04_04365 [Polaribacter sp. SA4-10]